MSLLRTDRVQTLDEVREIQEAIELSYQPAADYLFSRGAEEDLRLEWWQPMLETTHRRLFLTGRPDIAGVLRSEDLRVGGDGSTHGFEPVSHRLISQEIGDLWNDLGSRGHAWTSIGEFSHWSAKFLERFFFIHPFADGNGRIARLYLQRRARLAGWDLSWPSGGRLGGSTQAKYINALQYAHTHVNRGGDAMPGKNPFGPLSAWIQSAMEVLETVEVAPEGFE